MELDALLPPTTPRTIEPPRARAGAAPDAIRQTATEFESMVIGELIAPMFEALDSEGLGGGGAGERMFRPMLVREYAKSLVAAGGIGLSDVIAQEMIRMQTIQPGAVNADPR